MNRFFSKLDLRDIKIDPTGSRFPPDGEPVEEQPEVAPANEYAPEALHTAPDEVAAEPVYDGEAAAPAFEDEPAASAVHAPLAEQAASAAETAYAEPAHLPNGEATDVTPAEISDVLKVSAKSRPSAVAGAIAGVVRELGRAEVQAIGAGATNQAVKAVAIARDYLRESGIEAVCLPSFIDVTIDNEDRTAILLVVEPRDIAAD
jgi:stage V sporulation protein S